jgi:hypothetical protein
MFLRIEVSAAKIIRLIISKMTANIVENAEDKSADDSR